MRVASLKGEELIFLLLLLRGGSSLSACGCPVAACGSSRIVLFCGITHVKFSLYVSGASWTGEAFPFLSSDQKASRITLSAVLQALAHALVRMLTCCADSLEANATSRGREAGDGSAATAVTTNCSHPGMLEFITTISVQEPLFCLMQGKRSIGVIQ